MEGGGLSLEHDSIFSFLPTVTIKFSNNTAQRGGAIHIGDNVQSIACTNDLLNTKLNPPRCFFDVLSEN